MNVVLDHRISELYLNNLIFYSENNEIILTV